MNTRTHIHIQIHIHTHIHIQIHIIEPIIQRLYYLASMHIV